MVDLKDLKKGNYIVWEGEPCMIRNIHFNIGRDVMIEMQELFSEKINSVNVPITEHVMEADIIRKCATVISKKEGKLEIMDAVTFETIHADINDRLEEEASENDHVTYIQFGNISKVLEVRKQ